MKVDLKRLFAPASVALFGGSWAANVAVQLKKSGFPGEVWPVSRNRSTLEGFPCFKSVYDLPSAPDAAFVGVNREDTVDVVGQLSGIGAGGATCFASGFLETENDGGKGSKLQSALVDAAGDMPILGPNCYGFLNYLDNIALWPDQHGGRVVDRGVAIIAQSSNIAINMTMQRRNLPIGMMVTIGNQAKIGIAGIGEALLGDDRISAIGLYIESLGSIGDLEVFAKRAADLKRPVVVLKTGRSQGAQKAALTHTASVSGTAEFSSALFRRFGFVEVQDVDVFLETLKLLHCLGPLTGNSVAGVSCSGGEAGLVADVADKTTLRFTPFDAIAGSRLRSLLGPKVTISNPLDYHTYIWGDVPKMSAVFSELAGAGKDLCFFVLDLPREDRCDPSGYDCAVDAITNARRETGGAIAVVSLFSENIPEAVGEKFMRDGIVPLNGIRAGVMAIDACSRGLDLWGSAKAGDPIKLASTGTVYTLLDEVESKSQLEKAGISIPRSVFSERPAMVTGKAEAALQFPVVAKVLGYAHKSECGAVRTGIADPKALRDALEVMPAGNGYLVEEMVTGCLCELLVGVSRHAGGAKMLTIGAGGILAELFPDRANLVLPVGDIEVRRCLKSLNVWPILEGYRGRPQADIDGLVSAIRHVCDLALSLGDAEVEVNPLMVCETGAIAADAMIVTYRKGVENVRG